MGLHFFLSYARGNLDENQVKRFYADLEAELRRQLGEKRPDVEVGFMDRNDLKAGAEWECELMAALQASNTLVCLYSPAYFKSPWCGREWEVFRRRRQLYVENKKLEGVIDPPSPHAIKPIIWMASEAPGAVKEIQAFTFDSLDDIYRQRGLFYLIVGGGKYEGFIYQIAKDILSEKGLSLPALPLPPGALLGEVKSAFDIVEEVSETPAAAIQTSADVVQVAIHSSAATADEKTVAPAAGAWAATLKSLFDFTSRRKYLAALVAVLALALLLGGSYAVLHETKLNFDAEAVDDLFDRTVDYVTDAGWFWRAPVSAGWKVEPVEGYDKRIIMGSRIGLFKNGQTKNSFNMYQDFVLVFNARFSGDKRTNRRIGWVLRAKDFKNYYLFELVAAAGDQGRREFIATRYENGEPTMRINPQVVENIDNPSDSFEIRTEVVGSRFRVCLSPFSSGPPKPRMLGDFHDSTFTYGGVGFLPQPGMDAQLEFLRVIPNPNLAEEGCKP